MPEILKGFCTYNYFSFPTFEQLLSLLIFFRNVCSWQYVGRLCPDVEPKEAATVYQITTPNSGSNRDHLRCWPCQPQDEGAVLHLPGAARPWGRPDLHPLWACLPHGLCPPVVRVKEELSTGKQDGGEVREKVLGELCERDQPKGEDKSLSKD